MSDPAASDPASARATGPDASARPTVNPTDPTVPAEVPTDLPADAPADAPAEVAVRADKIGRSGRRRRTWPQRLLLALNIVVIVGCFAAAGGLIVSRYYGNTLNRVELADASENTMSGTTSPDAGGTGDTLVTGTIDVDDTSASPGTTDAGAPPETFPEADPGASNFLITGADNNACIDPDSKYAAAFGNREGMGERSDTIMIMRVDPSTKRAAVLSFPRDLWVKIAGRGSNNRINSAYVRDNPTRLLGTIYNNFGIEVDHFIQIDFCAFKTIVDGLGGVSVPFTYPARDVNTGLFVPEPGCFTFDGDHALAYVRSRKYQYMDESGKWKTDPVSDLGRVSRQQDFLRRVLSAALDRGVTDPDVARSLIKAAQENVVVDQNLTLNKMLEFVGVLRNFEPGSIATYQIEASGATIGGNSVLVPKINGDNMQAILAIFRGEASLSAAPEQVFETTTTVGPPSPDTTAGGEDEEAPTTTEAPATTVSEAPPVTDPEENVKGIVPPKDVQC